MQLIVFGMHRSGTSPLTRLVNLMGAYVGVEGSLLTPNYANPKGFWERRDVYALNQDVFTWVDADWFKVAHLDLERLTEEQRDAFRQRARTILHNLDTHRPWVLKDPRMCVLFSLWRPLLEAPVCLHVFRRPLEVAQSLKTRDGLPVRVGLALWEQHNLAALTHTEDLPRVFVSHQRLMQHPVETVQTLYEDLQSRGVHGLRVPSDREVLASIDPSLHHERVDAEYEQAFLTVPQVQLLHALESAAAGRPQAIPSFSASARDVLTDYEQSRAAAEAEVAAKESEVRRVREQLDGTKATLADLRVAAKGQRERFERLRTQLGQAEARLAALRTTAQRERERLQTDLAAVRDDAQDLRRTLRVQTAASERTRAERDTLQQQRSTLTAEVTDARQRLAAQDRQLASHDRELASLRRELRDRSADVTALAEWLRGSQRDVAKLLASRRWRMGHLLGELARRLALQPRTPMAPDHLERVFARFEAWQRNRPVPHDRQPGPAVSAKGASASTSLRPRSAPRLSTTVRVPPDDGPWALVFSHNLNGDEGAPSSLFELCRGLHSMFRHSLVIVSPTDGTLRPRYEAAGIPVIVSPSFVSPLSGRGRRDPTLYPDAVAALEEAVAEFSIAAVIANTVHGFHAIHAARSSGVPSMWIVRESQDPEDHFANSLHAELGQAFREALHITDALVFVSEKTRDRWLPAIDRPPETVKVIPNGLALHRFSGWPDRARSDVRAELGLKDDDLVLLNVGTICERKNQHLLLDAVVELPDRVAQKLTVLCVGASSGKGYSADFFDRIDQHERLRRSVRHVPPTDDVAAYYVASDAFVLTSVFESYPRVILEALYFSLPILASPAFGVKEQTGDHPCALYFDPHDPTSLADRIVEIVPPETRRALSEAARTQFLSLPDYRSMVHEYHGMLERLAPRPTPSDVSSEIRVRARISVIVPSYNYSRYLRERIASIVSQTLPPFEIIFLDDASSDDSVEVAQSFLEASPIPFRIIRNDTNEGTYRQWLRGIREATGELVWIAEADDTCEPEMLATLAQRMEDDRVVVAYCQSKRIDEDGLVTAPDNLHHTEEIDAERWRHDYRELGLREVVDYLVYRNTMPNVSACLLRKRAVPGIEEQVAHARFCGDRLLYAHMLTSGDVAYVARPLNGFRRHRASVTRGRSKSLELLQEVAQVRRYICEHFPIHASQLPRMNHFLDKDYKVDGVPRNSEHPAVKPTLDAIAERVGENRRLAFITTNNGSFDGGSELWWREAVQKLRALGHDVAVLIKKWDPRPPFLDEFDRRGIKSYLKEEDGFRAIIDFKPDLVTLSLGDQDEGTEYYGELRLHAMPYVIVNRLTKEPRFWPIRKDRNDLVRDGYLGAQTVFFTCRNNHRVMEERLQCSIPRWDRIFSPCHADKDAVLPFPSLSDGVRLAVPAKILFVHKGQDLLVEVLTSEKWKQRNVVVNIYGEGRDRDRLEQMARDSELESLVFHGRLVFLGRERDIQNIWLENHAIVMPSRMEGFPNMVVNAMISGRVPIVTDIGGHSEVIEDGVTGFIASAPSVEALDDALERSYRRRDEWETIGQRAKQAILRYLPADPVEDAAQKLLAVVNVAAPPLNALGMTAER